MTQASTPTGGQLAATLPPTASTPAPMKTFTQTEVEALVATASAHAATTERVRLAAIQAHPNASAQPGIVKLCIDTAMTAEQAAALLSAATTAAPAAPTAAANPFAAAMAAAGNPATSGINKPQQSHDDPAVEMRAAIAAAVASFNQKAAKA